MTKLYKLTDVNGYTRNNTKWGKNVTHTADGSGELCGPGWLHAYTDPLLAVLLNPIHCNYSSFRLWEAEGEIGKNDKGLKVGATSLTTIREIPIPKITIKQKIRFAILCAMAVYNDTPWTDWAKQWLSGNYCSEAAAAAARAAYAAAARAARAAGAAAYATEGAAEAVARAANAAGAAYAASASASVAGAASMARVARAYAASVAAGYAAEVAAARAAGAAYTAYTAEAGAAAAAYAASVAEAAAAEVAAARAAGAAYTAEAGAAGAAYAASVEAAAYAAEAAAEAVMNKTLDLIAIAHKAVDEG